MFNWFLNLFRRPNCWHDVEWTNISRSAKAGFCKLCGVKFGKSD